MIKPLKQRGGALEFSGEMFGWVLSGFSAGSQKVIIFQKVNKNNFQKKLTRIIGEKIAKNELLNSHIHKPIVAQLIRFFKLHGFATCQGDYGGEHRHSADFTILHYYDVVKHLL